MVDGQPAHRLIAATPNTLSALRLVLAIVFAVGGGTMSAAWRAAVIIAAGVSDLADGWIARRFGATSWAGGLLDAVADKSFTLAVVIRFAVEGHLAWWAVALLLSRDLAVGAIAAYAAATRQWAAFKMMGSRLAGRATTAVLFVLFVVMAIWPDARGLVAVLLAVTGALSLLAAVDYLLQFLHAWRRRRRGEI